MSAHNLSRLRNFYRIIMTLAVGACLLWAGSAARADLARDGRVEGMKAWLVAIFSAVIIALWLPWRPIRVAAAGLLLLVVGGAAVLGLIVIAGGPDSRGPQTAALPFLVIAALILCTPMAGFIYCERRMASDGPSPPR